MVDVCSCQPEGSTGSLHFHLETGGTSHNTGGAAATRHLQLGAWGEHVRACLRPSSLAHQRLIRNVRLLMRCDADEVDVRVLATRLAALGHRVQLRSALGGGPGTEIFHHLRHDFLVVSSDEGVDFIVEISFREHFAIPAPFATPAYRHLLDMIPPEVVAPACALAPLVQLLCHEMAASFQEHGSSLPPWRHAKALLSKWLPSKARDVDMSSPCDSPRRDRVAAPAGICALSTPTSGNLTPYSACQGDSPRAVLESAADALGHSFRSLPARKPRSLLSADLAAAYNEAAKEEIREIHLPPQVVPAAVAWQEPPIRRVRMQGRAMRA